MLVDPKWEVKFKASEVLRNAAQYLETHGWCQHAMQYKGRVCLFGAIRAVNRCSELSVELEITNRLRKTIRHTQVTSWNDATGRTKQEVIDVLNKAARG